MREEGLLARKLSLPNVDGDFSRAMNNNSSSSSRWNSGSSFCGRRRSKRRNENKTEKKKKSVVLCAWLFLSFTPTPQLLTVGCVMCCTNRKRDREFRSGVGRSVGNADDVERTNDSCVLSLRWCCCCWLVTTTLSIFSLHVGLFSAHAVLLTPRVRSAEE